MSPGTLSNPPSPAASAAGRPVITASVPTTPASSRRAPTAPGSARASRGSATIGASVPSKSVAISARAGSRRIAASPAFPSAVRAAPVIPQSPSSGRPGLGSPGAHPVPAGALPPQPLDQDGVEPQRLGPVDEVVQQLVVAGRGETKHVGDRLLLGA